MPVVACMATTLSAYLGECWNTGALHCPLSPGTPVHRKFVHFRMLSLQLECRCLPVCERKKLTFAGSSGVWQPSSLHGGWWAHGAAVQAQAGIYLRGRARIGSPAPRNPARAGYPGARHRAAAPASRRTGRRACALPDQGLGFWALGWPWKHRGARAAARPSRAAGGPCPPRESLPLRGHLGQRAARGGGLPIGRVLWGSRPGAASWAAGAASERPANSIVSRASGLRLPAFSASAARPDEPRSGPPALGPAAR